MELIKTPVLLTKFLRLLGTGIFGPRPLLSLWEGFSMGSALDKCKWIFSYYLSKIHISWLHLCCNSEERHGLNRATRRVGCALPKLKSLWRDILAKMQIRYVKLFRSILPWTSNPIEKVLLFFIEKKEIKPQENVFEFDSTL